MTTRCKQKSNNPLYTVCEQVCLYQHANEELACKIDAIFLNMAGDQVLRLLERRTIYSCGDEPGYTMISTLEVSENYFLQLSYELACERHMILYALVAQFHSEEALERCVQFLESYHIPYSLHLELLGCQESYW